MEYEMLRERKDGLFERTGEQFPPDLDSDGIADYCVDLRREQNVRYGAAFSKRQRGAAAKAATAAEKPATKGEAE